MKTTDTFLPLFQGFYNTIFEPDESFDLDEIPEDKRCDAIFDYDTYYNEVAEKCCKHLENELKPYMTNIEFQKVVSPKFYNFENDSINCAITINPELISQYLKDNADEFKGYIKEKYTSCDGFSSFYSNDYKEWLGAECLENEHNLGSILEFICINEEIELDYNSFDMPTVCCRNFDELTSNTNE